MIHFKWTSWARTFLLYELACYCLWLAFFTAFTLLFQAEDWTLTLWQSIQDRYRCVGVISYKLCTKVSRMHRGLQQHGKETQCQVQGTAAAACAVRGVVTLMLPDMCWVVLGGVGACRCLWSKQQQ